MDNPIVQEIIENTFKAKEAGIEIALCWIPSHNKITGNELADKKAKEATRMIKCSEIPILREDYIKKVKEFYKKEDSEKWKNTKNCKLRNIRDDIHNKNPTLSFSRRDQVVFEFESDTLKRAIYTSLQKKKGTNALAAMIFSM